MKIEYWNQAAMQWLLQRLVCLVLIMSCLMKALALVHEDWQLISREKVEKMGEEEEGR